MNVDMTEARTMLARTPRTLEALLSGLPEPWLHSTEGEGTWNAAQVVEHLIEADKTNWLPRLAFLLREGEGSPFPPFDRYAHLDGREARSIERQLQEFKEVRLRQLDGLQALIDAGLDPERTGLHPEFGVVRASELLATWVVHDLTHIAQIVRVLAERCRHDVGPWVAYLGILKK